MKNTINEVKNALDGINRLEEVKTKKHKLSKLSK